MGFLQALQRIPHDIGAVFHGSPSQPQQQQPPPTNAQLTNGRAVTTPQEPLRTLQAAHTQMIQSPNFQPHSSAGDPVAGFLPHLASNTKQNVAGMVKSIATGPGAHALQAVGDLATGNTQAAKAQLNKGGKVAAQGIRGAVANPGSVVGEGGLKEVGDLGADEGKGLTPNLKSQKPTPEPTHNAYGKKISMTEENGYKPLKTADGGNVYQKVAKTGSNAKGTQLTNTWYGQDGTKLTQAQADAMVKGDLRSAKPILTKSSQPSARGSNGNAAGLDSLINDRNARMKSTINNQAPKGSNLTVPKSPQPPVTAQRGLTTGIKGSTEFSAPLKSAVSSEYQPFTNEAATQSTDKFMRQSLKSAQNKVRQTLAAPTGKKLGSAGDAFTGSFGKQEVSNAGAVMKALDAKGDLPGAQEIHDLLAQKLTNAGQTSQAASLIYNRSPDGLKYMAQRDLTNAKVNITPELKSKMDAGVQAIKDAPEGSREQNLARGQFQKLVGKNIPSSTTDQAVGLWKSGLLSAPITAAKVAVVNPISSLLEQVKDIPASLVDRGASVFTGKRTTVAPNPTNVGAYLKAAGTTGMQDAGTKLMHNITMPGSSSIGTAELGSGTLSHPVSTNYSGGRLDKLTGGALGNVLNGYTQIASRTHGAITTPFYEGRGAQSLMQQGQAEALTQGLKGSEKQAFLKNFTENPTKQAQDTARTASEYATSQQKTALGQTASGLQHNLGPLGQFIAPITRIPGAVATQVINYSPIGIAKTATSAIIDGVKNGTFDQKKFSEGIGRGVTGTGIMYAGAQLANQGRMSGEYPTDRNEQALWQLENKPANSVYVGGNVTKNQDGTFKRTGGTWEQIGSAGGPAAQALLTGGAIGDGSKKGGAVGGIEQGISGGAKIVTDQPYLTGVSGAMSAIQTPDQAKSFYDQSAGSLIPNILRTAAGATDSSQRQTSVASPATSAKNAITNGIPGLREKNQPQVDVFGHTVPRNQGPVGTFLNPFHPQRSNTSNIDQNLESIRTNSKDSTGTPLSTVSQINKKFTIPEVKGKNLQLSDSQRTQFIQETGSRSETGLNKLIDSPQYKSANPQQKSKLVGDVVSGNRELGEAAIPGTKQSAKPSSNAKAADNNRLPTINSTGGVTTAVSKKDDPRAAYQAANLKFQQGVKDGSISSVDQSIQLPKLARQNIESNYSSDVTDLYSQSAQKIADYLNANPNSKLSNDVQKLDNQLVNAGIISKSKFSSTSITGDKIASASSQNAVRTKEFTALTNSLKAPKGSKLGKLSFPKSSKPRAVTFSAKSTRGPSGTKGIKLKKGVYA